MNKRILSILLAVLMLVSMIPSAAFTAFAAETPTIEVGGLTAPTAGQTVAQWFASITEEPTLSGADVAVTDPYWFEGKLSTWLDVDMRLYNGLVLPDGYTFQNNAQYTLVLFVDPTGGSTLPAAANVTAAGTSATAYEFVENGENDFAVILLTYTLGELPEITVTGVTAPTDGQTVIQYFESAPEFSFGEAPIITDASYWYAGKVSSYMAALAGNAYLEDTDVFVGGEQYTLILFVDSESGSTLPVSAEVTAAGTSATAYEFFENGENDFACIFLTFTAQGTSTTWTVSFAANGGGGTMSSETVNKGDSYTLPSCEFTAPQYKRFKAWDIGGTEYDPGETVTPSAHTTVTAVWEDIPVTGMTLDKDYIILNTTTDTGASKKDTDTVTVTVAPNNANANVTVDYASNLLTVTKNGPVDGVTTLTVKAWYYPGVTTVTVTSDGDNSISKTITVYVQEFTPEITIENGELDGFKYGGKYKICADGVADYEYTAPTGTGTWLTIRPEWQGKTLSIYEVSDEHEYCNSDACVVEVPSGAHNIVVNGGTAANSVGTAIDKATKDTVVTITAPKLSGKIFDKWVTTSNGVTINHPTEATTTFTMPYNDVEITATYTDVSVAMPNISFDTVKEQYTQPAAKAVAFTNNCTVRLTSPVITIASGSEYFELEISSVPGNIDPGATNNLSYAIKPKTGLARGTYTATIQLAANELVTPITATVTFTVGALTYQVNFDANGGTGSMTTVTHDTKDGQYTIPACTFTAPTGKVFDYWYMDNANNHLQAGDKVALTSNATLKAMWKDDLTIPHNIVVNGGTAANSIGTVINQATVDTVVTITAPKLSGKIFTGWVTTSNGVTINHPANETTTFTMPYNDVEITATYTDVSVAMPNISFDTVKEQYTQPAAKAVAFTNNCTVRLTSPVITIASGSEYFELEISSVPGNIDPGATNNLSYAIKPKTGLARGTYNGTIQLTANELVTPIQASVTFKVDALTYDVSFDSNGGTGSMTTVTHDTKDGQYTIPACTFAAPTGKVFDYWYMDNANNHLQAGDKVTLTSNATLKANWKDDLTIPHNIVVNGGTATNSVGTSIDKATVDTVVTITAPKLSGKIFDKWVTTSNGVIINHPTNETTTFTMPYNDVEITATYTDVSVAMPNIVFDSVKEQYVQPAAKPVAFTNNCDVRLTSPVITIASGSEYFELVIGSVPGAIEVGDTNTLSYAIKPKTGLTRGTYTAIVELNANELVTPVQATVTFTVEALTYQVSFDANGGTGSMTAVTHDTKDGQYTIPACAFTAPAGKVFSHWFMDVANNGLQAGDKVTLTSNATLKAEWKDDLSIPHNIVVNGGTAANSVGTAIDKATKDTVVTITAPKLSGKIFDKWVTTSNGVTINHPTEATTTFTMPYNDVEITATYTDVSVAVPNISFDSVKEGYTRPDAKPIAFTNDCEVRLTSPVITIASGSEYFELAIGSVPGAIEAGDTNNLSYAIRPKADLAKGSYTATIKLTANELVDPIETSVTFVVLENDNNGGNNGNNGNDGNDNNNNDNNGGNTDNKPSDNPQTGDNSMMWLWVALLFVSGFGVVGTTVIRRKKYSAR